MVRKENKRKEGNGEKMEIICCLSLSQTGIDGSIRTVVLEHLCTWDSPGEFVQAWVAGPYPSDAEKFPAKLLIQGLHFEIHCIKEKEHRRVWLSSGHD